jgi:hypothetical protein
VSSDYAGKAEEYLTFAAMAEPAGRLSSSYVNGLVGIGYAILALNETMATPTYLMMEPAEPESLQVDEDDDDA